MKKNLRGTSKMNNFLFFLQKNFRSKSSNLKNEFNPKTFFKPTKKCQKWSKNFFPIFHGLQFEIFENNDTD